MPTMITRDLSDLALAAAHYCAVPIVAAAALAYWAVQLYAGAWRGRRAGR